MLKGPTQDHKKENQKPQRSRPSYTKGKLSPPRTKSNTNISEAYDQLNLKLQEMLDRCTPETKSQQNKMPQNYGSITPYVNSENS